MEEEATAPQKQVNFSPGSKTTLLEVKRRGTLAATAASLITKPVGFVPNKRRSTIDWPSINEVTEGSVARISRILRTLRRNVIDFASSCGEDFTEENENPEDASEHYRGSLLDCYACNSKTISKELVEILCHIGFPKTVDRKLAESILKDFLCVKETLRLITDSDPSPTDTQHLWRRMRAMKQITASFNRQPPSVRSYLSDLIDVPKEKARSETKWSLTPKQTQVDIDVPHVTEMMDQYNILVENKTEINKSLEHIDKWGWDVFNIYKVTDGRPLVYSMYTILQKRKSFEMLEIQPDLMVNFLFRIEEMHHDIPYHSSTHAADVVQSAHVVMHGTPEEPPPLEAAMVLTAAAVHDVEHPGFTNQYLINTKHELAELYNGLSVLENHSYARFMAVLQEPRCDPLAGLSPGDRETALLLVREMVLATDMARHVAVIACMESHSSSSKTRRAPQGARGRLPLLNAIIHCADLSNPCKPLAIYEEWVDRIRTEFWRQGDMEKVQGMDISPMCDRETVDFDLVQVGFIDYVVKPIWSAVVNHCSPNLNNIMSILEYNRQHYSAKLKKDEDKRDAGSSASDRVGSRDSVKAKDSTTSQSSRVHANASSLPKTDEPPKLSTGSLGSSRGDHLRGTLHLPKIGMPKSNDSSRELLDSGKMAVTGSRILNLQTDRFRDFEQGDPLTASSLERINAEFKEKVSDEIASYLVKSPYPVSVIGASLEQDFEPSIDDNTPIMSDSYIFPEPEVISLYSAKDVVKRPSQPLKQLSKPSVAQPKSRHWDTPRGFETELAPRESRELNERAKSLPIEKFLRGNDRLATEEEAVEFRRRKRIQNRVKNRRSTTLGPLKNEGQ